MSELRTGLGLQNDPDAVMRRAAAATQPSNGNVVPFPQGVSAVAQSPAMPAQTRAPSTSGTTAATPDAGQDQGLIEVTNQIFGLESDFGRNPSTTPSKVGPAVGPMQITPDTWNQYAHPGEDINNVADNKQVGDRVVADLWNKSGGNKTAVLIGYNAGEGAMRRYLQTGQIPPNLETPYRNAIGVDGKTVGPDGQSPGQRELSRIGEQLTKVVEQISKEGGRSEESWKRLRESTDKMNEYQQKLLELAQKPPSPEPRDIFSRLGSLATVVGILGGALTRSPLATSLEAGAAAMDAYNKNDLLTYQFQRENWKTQLGVIEKMATFQNEQVRNLLYDENMQEGQKMNRLHALLSTLGHQEQAAQALLGDARGLRQWETSVFNANRTFSEKIKEDDERERHNRAMEAKQGAGNSFEATKTLEITDKDGNTTEKLVRESRGKTGFVDSVTGEPFVPPAGAQVKIVNPSTAGGGRAGAQVSRQMVSASEVAADLKNVSEMPSSVNAGIFGTVKTGPSVSNALVGDLTNTITQEDTQMFKASMAGFTRELSILISPVYGGNYAAELMNPLMPIEGDTMFTKLYKIARIRQTADNALRGAIAAPIMSKEQKDLAHELQKEMGVSIPWTPSDVVAFKQNADPKETFKEFAKKSGVQGASQALPADLPSPDGHVEGSTATDETGKIVAVIRNGAWAVP